MKKILLLIVVALCSASIYAQDMGLGVRFGDPSGLSFKKYLGDNALEVNFGRTKFLNGNSWYNSRFNNWYVDKNFGYAEFDYLGYSVSVPVALQVHYLFNNDLADLEGLQWYYGFGGQAAFQSYSFDYRYKTVDGGDWVYVAGDRVTDMDIGVDGVLGLEYTFEDAPISIFTDAVVFFEVLDNPFVFWWQGGIGARYNF